MLFMNKKALGEKIKFDQEKVNKKPKERKKLMKGKSLISFNYFDKHNHFQSSNSLSMNLSSYA